MPAPPQWFHHLAEALATLRASSALVIDRAGLEKLFGVSPRTAVRLLHRFGGGAQAGKTFLIGREELIRALEAITADETYQCVEGRRQRLAEDLERTRCDLRARRVKLPVASPDPPPGASLPAGMRIVRPGVLEVEFASAEDLLGRLYELVRMAAGDWDSLHHALGPSGSHSVT